MPLFCGIDWATEHHDVAVVDDDGRVVARGRVSNDAAGFAQLLTLLAEAGDSAAHPIPVGIETDRGLLVAALRETGRVIYPINPLAASRYRARYAVSGAKSDATDAVLLANIVRTDPGAHRPLPADTEAGPSHPGARPGPTGRGVGASADRQSDPRPAQRLLPGRADRVRRAVRRWTGPSRRPHHPGRCTEPSAGGEADPARLRRLLIKAGRQRHLDRDVERLREIFADTYLHQPPQVEVAMGIQLTALLRQFEAACTAADELAEAAIAHFEQHPDAKIITSFPGLGSLTGARVLAEIGDDRARFADARGLKAYAGAAPITRASGKKTVVLHRHIKNRRLAAVGPIWALGSLRASPGARRHFDARRATGDWNRQAQRHLFNKFLGQLHHCLQTRRLYNEHQAFPPPLELAA